MSTPQTFAKGQGSKPGLLCFIGSASQRRKSRCLCCSCETSMMIVFRCEYIAKHSSTKQPWPKGRACILEQKHFSCCFHFRRSDRAALMGNQSLGITISWIPKTGSAGILSSWWWTPQFRGRRWVHQALLFHSFYFKESKTPTWR